MTAGEDVANRVVFLDGWEQSSVIDNPALAAYLISGG